MSKLQSFLISLLISLFATTIVFAWNSPTSAPPGSAGEAMYVDSSGNVGIGTATPSRQLEVASTTAPAIAIQEGAKEWRIGVESSKFKIMETGVSDRFTIDTAGNVGIGTTTPITKFHVESSTTGGGGTVFLDDGFEDGTIDPFTTVGSNNIYWDVTSADKFAGAYSAKSGTLIDNQNTVIKISKTLTNSGTISFARKVSSETNYDKLYFFIDGVSQNYWSGEVAWSTVSYSVSAGTHEFSWTYIKDGSVSSGLDAAWIDSVEIIGNEVVSMASYFNNSWGGSAIQTGAGNVLISDSVGIGTTTPSTKLEVLGNADSILKLSRGSATSTIFRVGADGALVIQNQATDALIIKNGNVGIGTTGPGSILHTYKGGSGASIYSTAYSVLAVENNNHAMIDFLTPNNKQGGLYFNDPEQAAMAEFVYSHANDYFHFGVRPGVGQGMITAMVIKNNGNIGIATTTPAYPLAVAGTIYSSTGGFRFPDGTTQTTAVTAGWTLSGSNLYASSINYNVGIGTSTPITQLHVPGRIPSSAVGSITTGSNPYSVYVQGRYAYVVNGGSNTLQIFDISNPAGGPVSIGSVGTGSTPISVYVQGRYAYVANYNGGNLQIFDVSNPASPVNVGSINITSSPRSVYVQGRYAYVANFGFNYLNIIDVSNPASPVSVGSISTGSGLPYSVYVQGRYAYVVNQNTNTLQIFDVSNPASPVSVGLINTFSTPYSVYVQGRYAYVANYGGGNLQIFDVSNPASPVSVGSNTGTNPRSVYVQGRYAYVALGTGTLKIFDVSDPINPTIVGSITTNSTPISVYVQGRYAYVVNYGGQTLQIFDVGGAYIQQFEAGGIETGTLSTRSNLQVGNDLDVRGGLNVGRGIYTTGPFSVFGSSSDSIFSIDQNGNVGIGTASPVSKLSIAAPATLTVGQGSAAKVELMSNPESALKLYKGSDGSQTVEINGYQDRNSYFNSGGGLGIGTTSLDSNYKITTSGGGIKAESTTQPAGYFSSTSGYGLIVNSGNVGIGTTTPEAKLEINAYGVGNALKLQGNSADPNYYTQFYQSYGTGGLIITNKEYSQPDTIVTLKQGNVGIGTTSPGQQLSLEKTAGDVAIKLRNAGAGLSYTFGIDSADTNKFKLAYGGDFTTPLMTVDGTGNVGIGTANPTHNLEISANASYAPSVFVSGGEAHLKLKDLDAGTDQKIKGIRSKDGHLDFYYQTDAETTQSTVMRISSDGKVGIGTGESIPTSRLQVVGLPVYADNTAAIAGGLTAGAFYRTSTGVLMVVY